MTESTEPGHALAIVAHPDDIEFSAGGTVAGWVARGWKMHLCVVTDGEHGTYSLPADRRAEQLASADTLGITRVHFLGMDDSQVEPTLELRATVSELIRSVRPRRVLTHSPKYAWVFPPASHPDHRAVGAVAVDAVYPGARIPGSSGGALSEPWSVSELWLFGDPEANHFEDVTNYMPGKLAALRCHYSQRTGGSETETGLRERMAAAAQSAGMPTGRLAERFQILAYP
ncbi:LmbE family N-acetylglucosaminyl deacetylase [Prauserella isguenensis]|uniref:LmbE family N-acetylglucosaminyl deacetylase n=1 Tax=Prauserella isguenensis TaxID=1470180 RepID=A0A839S774_9PSEU|nr:PIG-L deacetylase family protein [Prauserella isguenensis]MBB3053123.1 LmbE family N-acetylglucosaminyl deacetylase [Prauserella isguenensis]